MSQPPKFSIILNCYDVDMVQRHQTMACLAAIRKFTEPPYEIIVVDNAPVHRIRDEYYVLEPYTLIEVPLETVYESYNRGAAAATTDYFFFIQNDVYVHEKTLNRLMKYLKKWDVVFPQQIPISRMDVKEIYKTPTGRDTHIGGRDAGLLGITREAFEKTGGWDGRFCNLLGEAAFYAKIDDAGLSWTDRTTAFITHLMAGNNLRKEEGLYNEEMAHDAKLLEEYK